MPDPNTEHGLRVQLATALRERDTEKSRADAAEANALAVAQERLEERAQRDRDWDALKAALAAARTEIIRLRAFIDAKHIITGAYLAAPAAGDSK